MLRVQRRVALVMDHLGAALVVTASPDSDEDELDEHLTTAREHLEALTAIFDYASFRGE